jgi:hypothetical protein
MVRKPTEFSNSSINNAVFRNSSSLRPAHAANLTK